MAVRQNVQHCVQVRQTTSKTQCSVDFLPRGADTIIQPAPVARNPPPCTDSTGYRRPVPSRRCRAAFIRSFRHAAP
jgi:hypothetical protein